MIFKLFRQANLKQLFVSFMFSYPKCKAGSNVQPICGFGGGVQGRGREERRMGLGRGEDW